MENQLNKTFQEIISAIRFTEDKLLITQLDECFTDTDEFRWYSKIIGAIERNEDISEDEKIHFLAMHRTFLFLTKETL